MEMTSTVASHQRSPRLEMMRNRRTHETSRVGLVGSDLVVNHDESLLDDERDLSTGEGVLQSVSKEDLNTTTIGISRCSSLQPCSCSSPSLRILPAIP